MKKIWSLFLPTALMVVSVNSFGQGIGTSNTGTSGNVPGSAGGVVTPPNTIGTDRTGSTGTGIDRDSTIDRGGIDTTRPSVDDSSRGGIDTGTRSGTMSNSGECICSGDATRTPGSRTSPIDVE